MRISDWSADVCSSDLKGLDCSSAPQSWPRLVVRVLVAFFGGRSPAISRLIMAREYIEMPVDFMECWVTSLWALDNIEVLMPNRSEEHTSELQSLMRISYAVFCFKKKKQKQIVNTN